MQFVAYSEEALWADLWDQNEMSETFRLHSFWSMQSEERKRELLQLDKNNVPEYIREQRQMCSCSVCGRRLSRIEEEIKQVYKQYFQELEDLGDSSQEANFLVVRGDKIVIKEKEFKESAGDFFSIISLLRKGNPEECNADFDPAATQHEDSEEERKNYIRLTITQMLEKNIVDAYKSYVAKLRQEQLLKESTSTSNSSKNKKEGEKRKIKIHSEHNRNKESEKKKVTNKLPNKDRIEEAKKIREEEEKARLRRLQMLEEAKSRQEVQENKMAERLKKQEQKIREIEEAEIASLMREAKAREKKKKQEEEQEIRKIMKEKAAREKKERKQKKRLEKVALQNVPLAEPQSKEQDQSILLDLSADTAFLNPNANLSGGWNETNTEYGGSGIEDFMQTLIMKAEATNAISHTNTFSIEKGEHNRIDTTYWLGNSEEQISIQQLLSKELMPSHTDIPTEDTYMSQLLQPQIEYSVNDLANLLTGQPVTSTPEENSVAYWSSLLVAHSEDSGINQDEIYNTLIGGL